MTSRWTSGDLGRLDGRPRLTMSAARRMAASVAFVALAVAGCGSTTAGTSTPTATTDTTPAFTVPKGTATVGDSTTPTTGATSTLPQILKAKPEADPSAAPAVPTATTTRTRPAPVKGDIGTVTSDGVTVYDDAALNDYFRERIQTNVARTGKSQSTDDSACRTWKMKYGPSQQVADEHGDSIAGQLHILCPTYFVPLG